MYTITVSNDNTATATEQGRILQRTKNIDTLRIIIPKLYNNQDFSPYSVLMEFKLPVSHEVNLKELKLTDASYKDNYNLYEYVLGTEFTKEPGDVEIQLTIVGLIMDSNGVTTEIARHISPFAVPIVSVADWFNVPDSELTTLTQYYLAAKQQILALNDLAATLNDNMVDDIKLDVENGEIYLVSGSKRMGTGIMLSDLNSELVEIGGKTNGNMSIQQL